MKPADAVVFVNQISCPPFVLSADYDPELIGSGRYRQLRVTISLDTVESNGSGKWFQARSTHACFLDDLARWDVYQLVQFVYQGCRYLTLHELDEHFHFMGDNIFDPHDREKRRRFLGILMEETGSLEEGS